MNIENYEFLCTWFQAYIPTVHKGMNECQTKKEKQKNESGEEESVEYNKERSE